MSVSRRWFLERTAGVAGALAAGCGRAESVSRQILVNHVGFTPGSAKYCILAGTKSLPFTVVNVAGGAVAYRGTLVPGPRDLGDYVVGEFHSLETPGDYEIRAAEARSGQFHIGPGVFDDAKQSLIAYFAKQRCGDSRTGHHAPCHLDDGKRADNGRHQDVTGGWHDACDLRKWVQATIYGMIGLGRALEVEKSDTIRRHLLDELRWGNAYFCKMQEPDGYVMDYCGGDDGNDYTDNIVGSADDRVIHVDPCELPVQFHFVSVQASMARATLQTDPEYSKSCKESAQKCLEWCLKNRSPGAATSLAAAVIALIGLHKLTPEGTLSNAVGRFMRRLLALQVAPGPGDGGVHGYFLAAPDHTEPSREIMHGNLPLLAMTEALEHFPEDADAGLWKAALKLHTEHLLLMAGRSAFGTVPLGLYSGGDPGGNRRLGRVWYRYFMKPRGEQASAAWWWVGINSHLASHGIGLARASRLLGQAKLLSAAQRQLDWIVGANPFDASTISGVGRNQPRLYSTNTFSPPTPVISGGVMNGIGGDEDDQPRLDAGSWNTCEYWTPMVCHTLWLMTELHS